jgi:ABC-type spermidine/putrescine transport system permease subunit II
VTASAIVALVAALLALVAAGCIVYLLVRARANVRTLEQEFERGRKVFEDIVARELEQRALELEQAL